MELNTKKEIGKITIIANARDKQWKSARECDMYQENNLYLDKKVKI